jgi:hypothetical protein
MRPDSYQSICMGRRTAKDPRLRTYLYKQRSVSDVCVQIAHETGLVLALYGFTNPIEEFLGGLFHDFSFILAVDL